MDIDADVREIDDLTFRIDRARMLLKKITSGSLISFRLDIEDPKADRGSRFHFIDHHIDSKEAEALLKRYIKILKIKIDRQRPKENRVIRITIDETSSIEHGMTMFKPNEELLIIIKNTEGVVRAIQRIPIKKKL